MKLHCLPPSFSIASFSRTFLSNKGEHGTRVTFDEEQGTTRRGKKGAEVRVVRFLLLAFLCAQIYIEREARLGTFGKVILLNYIKELH